MATITEFDGELDSELLKAIDGFATNVAASTRATYQTLDKVNAVLKRLVDDETKEEPEKEPRKWSFKIIRDSQGRMETIEATRVE